MRIALILPLMVFGCADETISGYADSDATYQLVEIDGAAFTAQATIQFHEEGRAQGSAPCNQWSAVQIAPYPWFDLGPIAATRRACPEMEDETLFFRTLALMSLSEVQETTLILSNDDGQIMVFEAK